MKKRSFPEVGRRRREQIVEAAVAVIAEQGLQHCSLSAIEKRAGMCRGQLTYYFPTKEAILLAVFDHLLQLMVQQVHGEGGAACTAPAEPGWERCRHFLKFLLLEPVATPEFHSLQYTFLSQTAHRDDFRQRLADLYQEFREGIARDCEVALERTRAKGKASARTVATLIQAIVHGLAVQRHADPECYDPEAMLKLCVDLLGSYLAPKPTRARQRRPRVAKSVSANGSATHGAARQSAKGSRVKHG